MSRATFERMNPDTRKSWAHALRSGEFKLGPGFLCILTETGLFHDPLGVLCELGERASVGLPRGVWRGVPDVLMFRYWDCENGVLALSYMRWAGLHSQIPFVNVTMEQRMKWNLPENYRRGQLRVPLTTINDHSEATPDDIAELIETQL